MDLNKVGWLYFIRSETQHAVKIGFADNVYQRHKSLQTGNPGELLIVCELRATLGAERAIHKLLKHRRHRLEWYVDDGFADAIIDELQGEILDGAMEWLLEHAPHAVGAEVFDGAIERQVLTAADVMPVIRQLLEEWVEDDEDDAALNEPSPSP